MEASLVQAQSKALGDRMDHDSPSSSAAHDCSTISFTLRSYSLRFSWYSRAASELAGELGLGSHSSDWIEVRMAEMS